MPGQLDPGSTEDEALAPGPRLRSGRYPPVALRRVKIGPGVDRGRGSLLRENVATGWTR